MFFPNIINYKKLLKYFKLNNKNFYIVVNIEKKRLEL